MAFDFPSSPAVGDIFTDAASGASYSWNGAVWSRGYREPAAGADHPPAETIPLDPPVDGETTVQGSLQKLSVEVDTLASETGNKVDVAGDTMTGPLILSEHPTAASPEFQAATRGYVGSIAGLPPGGTVGQTLAITSTGVPEWGAVVDAGNF
jgi:hypothetical protein